MLAGRRDLSLIRESGSTARVLNLAHVFEKYGHTEEHGAQPFFRNKRLNRALLLKHAVRADERELFSAPPISATKVVLPFAAAELALGGVSFMVGQAQFERTVREAVGGYEDGADFERDLDLLQLLAALPSFDPFLMRERLRHYGEAPARCYFDVSEGDVTRMRAFVGGEIQQLVDLAFANGGPSGRDLSRQLADKLMTDETAKALDPLRETLRMDGDAYREGVFAWKGFLYYKWLVADLETIVGAQKRQIAGARISRASAQQREQLRQMRLRIISALDVAAGRVQEELLGYDSAFAALAAGSPGAFRDFLIAAPARFGPIGEAIGVIKHIQSFWSFRFPGQVVAALDVEEALELFQEFDLTLASVAFVKEGGSPALML